MQEIASFLYQKPKSILSLMFVPLQRNRAKLLAQTIRSCTRLSRMLIEQHSRQRKKQFSALLKERVTLNSHKLLAGMLKLSMQHVTMRSLMVSSLRRLS